MATNETALSHPQHLINQLTSECRFKSAISPVISPVIACTHVLRLISAQTVRFNSFKRISSSVNMQSHK